MHVVARADESRRVAAKALAGAGGSDLDRERYEKVLEDPEPVLRALKKHSTVVSQNLTNGIVNSFQRYFSSIIQTAAKKRPEMLSSSQHVKLDDVLKFSRHKDLISFIIDRKINELSYGGLNDMERYFDDRLGVPMFNEDKERKLLRLFFEIRNINVHNGGIVNDIFSGRVGDVPGFSYKIGKNFHVDFDSLSILSMNAMKVAEGIDRAVSAKFKIRCKTCNSWQKRSVSTRSNSPQR